MSCKKKSVRSHQRQLHDLQRSHVALWDIESCVCIKGGSFEQYGQSHVLQMKIFIYKQSYISYTLHTFINTERCVFYNCFMVSHMHYISRHASQFATFDPVTKTTQSADVTRQHSYPPVFLKTRLLSTYQLLFIAPPITDG